LGMVGGASSLAETRAIDPQSSVITVRVSKTGLFSALAHDHVIEARGLRGTLQTEGTTGIEFTLEARQLKVTDPDVSEKDRNEIQQTMDEKVLEINKFPEIRFQSISVESQGSGRWQIRGNLSLHGQTHPIAFAVQESSKRYRGTTTMKQTDFGIEPIKIAGGTIRVKDEITIEFDVALTGSR
jgi:polyisoprenoid-binding protein YceI